MSNHIVIPMKNHWELTNNLLKDLVIHESQNIDQVLIVNDHSTDKEVYDGLSSWLGSKLLPVNVLTHSQPLGFTLAANFGLQEVTGDFAEQRLVFLISNDVRIHSGFIYKAEDILLGARRALLGNTYIRFDSGWNKFGGKVFDYLDGYFLAATSDGWRDLGYFDPNYAPGDFEDVDLSTTAKKKGYKLESLNNPNIVHLGAGTTGYTEERLARTKLNQGYFRKKWMSE